LRIEVGFNREIFVLFQELFHDGPEKGASKRAIVVFDSRYGNTEKIAQSLRDGLKEVGIDASCFNENQVQLEALN
jgi:flavorubredoxin